MLLLKLKKLDSMEGKRMGWMWSMASRPSSDKDNYALEITWLGACLLMDDGGMVGWQAAIKHKIVKMMMMLVPHNLS